MMYPMSHNSSLAGHIWMFFPSLTTCEAASCARLSTPYSYCKTPEGSCETCPEPTTYGYTLPATSAGMPEHCVVDTQPRLCVFGRESCGHGNLSYTQPPRAQSFKPINTYCRPTAPVESETVYRKSYYPFDVCAMQHARLGPIIRKDNIEKTSAKMEDKTVMSLSYMGHCGVKPPAPIIPMQSRLMRQGSISTETTQRHDFVPKPTMRVHPILPAGNMAKTCAPLEKETTFRLSYMPIDLCQNPPPKPIIPIGEYRKSTLPAETDTIYKLSYAPVCPPAKDDCPWARKISHSNPCAPIEKDTVYKLSYLGNCGLRKVEPFLPVSCLKLFDGASEKCSVYKASYLPACAERPAAILPQPNIVRTDAPVEKDTVYKLSYMGHCNTAPPGPIMPAPSKLRSDGPMCTETTQRRDFAPKPMCTTAPFLPMDNTVVSREPMEKDTIYKLSYIPTDMCSFQRTQPIRPISETCKSMEPMEHLTTHRLSYMPVCPPKREPMPWATRNSYHRPSEPMESCTIQRMSYQPPGMFLDGSANCLCRNAQQLQFERHTFPKAGIVN